jgi:hypothetical protein
VIAPEKTAYLAFTVLGTITGLGMLFVRPSPGEPEQLDRLFPLTRFLAYRPVRIVFSVMFFAVALAGVAFTFGWL